MDRNRGNRNSKIRAGSQISQTRAEPLRKATTGKSHWKQAVYEKWGVGTV